MPEKDKKKTIAKDTPLAEITLRRYERPSNLKGRELVRKLCLSVGLLQPGDSRDIVVDVLNVLIKAAQSKEELISQEIEKRVIEERKRLKLPLLGIAPSNIRRQLKRLKDLFLIESVQNRYRVTEFELLEEIFAERIEKYYLRNIVDRVREYFKAVK
ncbi:hypothetical protein J4212_06495 [Candidatus Woesearchaeota archaeon]|nr:hypothetical protein [Candidatus Woesearchaeota archaeon]